MWQKQMSARKQVEEAGLTLTESLSEEAAGDKDKHVKKNKCYKNKKNS